jgi:hypothetical protein
MFKHVEDDKRFEFDITIPCSLNGYVLAKSQEEALEKLKRFEVNLYNQIRYHADKIEIHKLDTYEEAGVDDSWISA